METTLVHLLPLSIALAFSTVPILAALLILLSPNRSRSAVPFLIGWIIGMFGIAALCTVLAQYIPSSRLPRREDETVGILEIVVGAALILLGIFSIWRARRRGPKEGIPKWLKSAETLGPFSSFGLAILLNLRPKSLLLAIAAGLALRADAGSVSAAVVSLAIYTAIGASTVAVPIIATVASPKRTEPKLISAREWLVRHGEVITSAIVILIGAIVIWVGISRL
jgi:hypothetical protein